MTKQSTRSATDLIKFDVLTAERLRQILDYDPATGIFLWKLRLSRRIDIGMRAGRVNGRGYRIIGIDGKEYRAARLAWLYMHGEWPPTIVDHDNTISIDDRFENLRLANASLNQANTRQRSDQKIAKGVSWHRRGKFWTAQITCNGIRQYLGSFETSEDAARAYEVAAINAFGSFARMS